MNLNGRIVIEHDWKYTSSTSTKNLRIDWGGVWVAGPSVSTSVSASFLLGIKNANSLSSQFLLNSTSFGTSPMDTTAIVDTTQDVAIDFKCNWSASAASEQIVLRGYSVWYYPGND